MASLCCKKREKDRKDSCDLYEGKWGGTFSSCLGLGCVTTPVMPARTPRLHENVVYCVVMLGLSSARINSLHNSIHPPEMERIPPKVVCGCPCVGVVKAKVIHAVVLPDGIWLSMYSCISGDPQNVRLRECYNNNNCQWLVWLAKSSMTSC